MGSKTPIYQTTNQGFEHCSNEINDPSLPVIPPEVLTVFGFGMFLGAPRHDTSSRGRCLEAKRVR